MGFIEMVTIQKGGVYNG